MDYCKNLKFIRKVLKQEKMIAKAGTWFIVFHLVVMNILSAGEVLSPQKKEAIAEAIFRYEMARSKAPDADERYSKKLIAGPYDMLIENHEVSFDLEKKLEHAFPLVFDPSKARETISLETFEFLDNSKSKVKVTGTIIYGFVTKYAETTVYYELEEANGVWQVKNGYIRDRSTWDELMKI